MYSRTQFSIFCVLASPLLISGSIQRMSAANLATYSNKEAIAISQDSLGLQGQRVQGGR